MAQKTDRYVLAMAALLSAMAAAAQSAPNSGLNVPPGESAPTSPDAYSPATDQGHVDYQSEDRKARGAERRQKAARMQERVPKPNPWPTQYPYPGTGTDWQLNTVPGEPVRPPSGTP